MPLELGQNLTLGVFFWPKFCDKFKMEIVTENLDLELLD